MSTTLLLLLFLLTVFVQGVQKNGDGLSLWIDSQQVKMFSGYAMGEIHVIDDGIVLPYLLDPNFENYLPMIPSEVNSVNFTWRSGNKKYFYHFDILKTLDESILDPPQISIKAKGKIPKRPKVFSVLLPCSGNRSGIAPFEVGLLIETRKGKPLVGTPLRLKIRKECAPEGIFPAGPDPECDKKCANGGWCNHDKICQCPEGYMGLYCKTALCYPQCMNGGNCTAPGVCSCPNGYQGRHCEGGICRDKCLNGGKCIQKDTCECPKGYFGRRCEYSKCVIPCLNGGKCRGANKCRCPLGYRGNHCEIDSRVAQRSLCTKPCAHGSCQPDNTCLCDPGWSGRRCQLRVQLQKKKGTT
ncbi:UNVERIFIED_CONTAM: hypothetical protein PYX00_001097 [Menopon gallinae]|uniref:Wnt inhibitory factor 1 n=1 Tax=Menopon gallinae TaxID=328185 RepID=A0AAW2ICP0_9NEOP